MTKGMKSLKQLTLNLTSMDLNSIKIICNNGEFAKNLTELNVAMNGIDSEGVKVIASCEHLTNLKSLNLYYNRVDSEGVNSIIHSKYLKQLTELNLGDNDNIGSDSVALLSSTDNLKHLQILELHENMIGSEGVKSLSNASLLNQITRLNLSCNDLCSEDVALLAKSENLKNLTELSLSRNVICSQGVKYLSESDCTLQRLRVLDLSENWLDEEALHFLSTSLNFENLTRLSLANNRFLQVLQPSDHDEMIKIFKQEGQSLKNLRYVDIFINENW
ncbi:hypothetical protein C9374_004793 [Naegleria lovaniensis]|uniref:Uncharacterized protein n=1 Tax=Naegleria lovaniensis TaxID=51637 RepID=A0AA88GPD5_NAELO|nr:uncharacterized protein C9374_004793 [Naegleria lovaniensis]KAG2382826.1 hypothetical protein C9374_004793 [Naegleria lovaniensis]